MDTITLIGALGALIILIAFFLNQTHKWGRDELKYDLANLIGGLLLVAYAWMIHSYPFLVLNAVWTLVALRDVVKKLSYEQ